jgi:hypothetical protein
MAFTRHLTRGIAGIIALLSVHAPSCADEQPAVKGSKLAPCARNDALATKLGCEALGAECEPPPSECDALADAWFTCVERDLRQCICEATDRHLNCEGSFKDDEGPALCVFEYMRFDNCLDEYAPEAR